MFSILISILGSPFADLSAEDVTLILEQGSKFVEDKIYPLNKVGDLTGVILIKIIASPLLPVIRRFTKNFATEAGITLVLLKNLGDKAYQPSLLLHLKNIAFQQTWLFQCIPV